LGEKKVDAEIYIRNKETVEKKYDAEFGDLFYYQKYKLVWHKQVTADAYSMFMRKAFLTKERGNLVMDLFQNDFNYVYMAEVTTNKTKLSRSAFGYATFAEVNFDGILFSRNSFVNSQIHQCSFKNGKMSNTDFSSVKFEHTVFEQIEFENCSFYTADFRTTSFNNCTGLKQEHFNSSVRFDDECRFPDGIVIEHNDDYLKRVEQSAAAEQPKQTVA
jgi:uncharacterized protein YjbI with pentapeptide repeats